MIKLFALLLALSSCTHDISVNSEVLTKAEAVSIIYSNCNVYPGAYLAFEDDYYLTISPTEVLDIYQLSPLKYSADFNDCDDIAVSAMTQFYQYFFGYVRMGNKDSRDTHASCLFISPDKKVYIFDAQISRITPCPKEKLIYFGFFP